MPCNFTVQYRTSPNKGHCTTTFPVPPSLNCYKTSLCTLRTTEPLQKIIHMTYNYCPQHFLGPLYSTHITNTHTCTHLALRGKGGPRDVRWWVVPSDHLLYYGSGETPSKWAWPWAHWLTAGCLEPWIRTKTSRSSFHNFSLWTGKYTDVGKIILWRARALLSQLHVVSK